MNNTFILPSINQDVKKDLLYFMEVLQKVAEQWSDFWKTLCNVWGTL